MPNVELFVGYILIQDIHFFGYYGICFIGCILIFVFVFEFVCVLLKQNQGYRDQNCLHGIGIAAADVQNPAR